MKDELMLEVLNRFRTENGKQTINNWDSDTAYNCWLHSLDMSKHRNVYHAPDWALEGWAECTAMCGIQNTNIKSILEYLVFGVFGQSDEHKRILLNANLYAGSIVIDNWVAYLTIRCK